MIPATNEANQDKKPHKKLRFWTWVFSILIVALPLFYVVENWRGERAFAKMQAEIRAKGEPASYMETFPAENPETQNFFKQQLVMDEIAGKYFPKLERLSGNNFYGLVDYPGDSYSIYEPSEIDFLSWFMPEELTSGMTQNDAAERILVLMAPYHDRMNAMALLLKNALLN